MYLAVNKIVPPREYQHNTRLISECGFTVQDYLKENKLPVPSNWKYNQKKKSLDQFDSEVSEDKINIYFMFQNDKDQQNQSVVKELRQGQNYERKLRQRQQSLQSFSFDIQKQSLNDNLIYKNLIQNNLDQYCKLYQVDQQTIISNTSWSNNEYRQTFAMFLASNKILPPEEFEHESRLQDIQNRTVAIILEINGIEVPYQWKYDSMFRLEFGCTTAMKIAEFGHIPSNYWHHDPTLVDTIYKKTVAQYLADNRIIPPQQWQYNPNQQIDSRSSVALLLAKNYITPPYQWKHSKYLRDKYNNTVQDYLTRIQVSNIPDLWKYDTDIFVDEFQNTKAMLQAMNGQIPDTQCYHDPEISNKNNETVAIILAKKGIVPPQEWQHNSVLTDDQNCTVAVYLELNNIKTPYEWQYNQSYVLDEYKNTTAMKIASYGHVPSQCWLHETSLKNADYETLKIYLQDYNDTMQNEWFKIIDNNEIEYQYFNDQDNNEDKKIQESQNTQNKYGQTVALILAMNGVIPPKEWLHNKYLRDNNNKTVFYYLKEKKCNIPEEWDIQKTIKISSEIRKKLGQYCKEYDIKNTQLIINNPSFTIFKDECQFPTFAIWLADKGIVPPNEFHHDPELTIQGFTVASKLAYNGIIPPIEWMVDTSILYKYQISESRIVERTVAHQLAFNRIIPPQQWSHDPNIQSSEGFNVQDYLILQKIQVPQQWRVNDETKIINYQILKELYNFCNKYNVSKQRIINEPEWQDNEDKNTFSMYLSLQGILPTNKFYHKPLLSNKYSYTVAHCLASVGIISPKQWYIESSVKTWKGNTVAMILASKGIVPKQPWVHNSYLYYQEYDNETEQIKYFGTIAMLLAQYGIYAPECWIHDRHIRDSNGQTVQDILTQKNVSIPEEWIYDQNIFVDDNYNTQAMIQAKQGKSPEVQLYHDPQIQNKQGYTVAMYLAENNIKITQQWVHYKYIRNVYGFSVNYILRLRNKPIPEQWYYDVQENTDQFIKYRLQQFCQQYDITPDQVYKNGGSQDKDYSLTFAMYLYKNNLAIQPQFYHKPLIQDIYQNTIGILMSQKGIIPFKYWLHEIEVKNNNGESIRTNLSRYNYIWRENKFMYNVQTEKKTATCQRCQKYFEQNFIKAKCSDIVCFDCFNELMEMNKIQKCPICQSSSWLQPINKAQYQRYVNFQHNLKKQRKKEQQQQKQQQYQQQHQQQHQQIENQEQEIQYRY